MDSLDLNIQLCSQVTQAKLYLSNKTWQAFMPLALSLMGEQGNHFAGKPSLELAPKNSTGWVTSPPWKVSSPESGNASPLRVNGEELRKNGEEFRIINVTINGLSTGLLFFSDVRPELMFLLQAQSCDVGWRTRHRGLATAMGWPQATGPQWSYHAPGEN